MGASASTHLTLVRITTGSVSDSGGTLDVAIDNGTGVYTWVTRGASWALSSTVLETSYATLLGVRVHSPTNNGWSGSVEYSSDGGVSYAPFPCTSSCSGDAAPIAVDGDDSSGLAGSTRCVNGDTCTLSIPQPPLVPPSPSPPPPSPSPPPPSAPVCRVLISRQTVVAGDSWLRTDAEWSINPLDPSAAQFSILDQLEGMGRNPDGDNKILFELYWPELEGTLKGPRQLWKQSSNPVIGVPGAAVEGYEAVDAPYTGCYWGGLERSSHSALLDGSSNSWWWYAVGSRSSYIPGPCNTGVSQTEL